MISERKRAENSARNETEEFNDVLSYGKMDTEYHKKKKFLKMQSGFDCSELLDQFY